MASPEQVAERMARREEKRRKRQEKAANRSIREKKGYKLRQEKAALIYGEQETDLKPCVCKENDGSLVACPYLGKLTRGKHDNQLRAHCGYLSSLSLRTVRAGSGAQKQCLRANHDVRDFLAEGWEASPPPDS